MRPNTMTREEMAFQDQQKVKTVMNRMAGVEKALVALTTAINRIEQRLDALENPPKRGPGRPRKDEAA